ncbi:MAG: hypothetical protein KKD44_17330 [Proteobacteria bacterium]|nr:hypothetical protein [Pseudomonadota bacterium]
MTPEKNKSICETHAFFDGIDVTQIAYAAGIPFPVKLATRVWESCIKVPKEMYSKEEYGRIWDVLYKLRNELIRFGSNRNRHPQNIIHYEIKDPNMSTRTIALRVIIDTSGGKTVLAVMEEQGGIT